MKTLLIILILILGGLFAGLILLFNYGAHRHERDEEETYGKYWPNWKNRIKKQ